MYKLQDNQLIILAMLEAQQCKPAGSILRDLSKLPVADRQALGWYKHVEYTAGLTDSTVDPDTDTLYMPAPDLPEPDPHFEISRLKLKRALAAAGLWTQVKAYIESEEDVSDDFWLASVLRTDDPVMVGAIAALKTLTRYTDEQVQSLLESARI